MLERDRRLVREASKFLLESIIPQFVRDCIQLSVTPLDGEALRQALHARGINMRYLGEVAKLAAKREDLQHLQVSVCGACGECVHVCVCRDFVCLFF